MSDDAAAVIRATLADLGVEAEEPRPGSFVVQLPGERKLRTTCVLDVGEQAVTVHAFVARRPDENHEGVYRYLLERNLRLYGVAFAVDHLGDIHLTGKVALTAVTSAEIDRILGTVLDAADSSFNQLLELGFAGAIRREWEWRTSRGESTANLAAFRHLLPGEE
ncbi:YbjN domain-containing protein [Actinopolymorpha singaporensis]|uniref:Putative sensory transduction regulator n=1 Tax=Actinopolymorpha singaporensis TaxID=117157 RepID=A0A1H1LR09_9ACTN|nr:YbjN domain-containing protein [Actinopolymorpha singaporensis]SDR76953.1 Putative sensory transduction regulator [Actinopolymorpha singaporensis]